MSIRQVPQCPRRCAENNHWDVATLRVVTQIVNGVVRRYGGDSTRVSSNVIYLLLIYTLHLYVTGGDSSRVYLVGQSMGGHGAWTFASQQRSLFAAVLVVCGYTNGEGEEEAVAARLVDQALPVGVVHAADDSVIPVHASDTIVKRLGQIPPYEGHTAVVDPTDGTCPIHTLH